MGSETALKIAAARRAADVLAAAGRNKEAEDVRSLCRANSALAETARRLRADNEALRGRG